MNTNLEVYGNMISNVGTYGGSGNITLKGSNVQTVTRSTGFGLFSCGTFTVDKTGGSMELGSALSYVCAGQNFTVTNGTVNMNNYNLGINNVCTLTSGAINKGTGSLTYASTGGCP
jgi:hypothetical protein